MPDLRRRAVSLLRRAWVPECVGFFLVLWQEAVRLELRSAHRILPIPSSLTELYYFQFGDFVNGYINAFIVDGLTDWFRSRRDTSRTLTTLAKQRQAVAATIVSIAVIAAVELIPNAFNNADWRDIPAGVAGALLYLGIRLLALRWQRAANASG